MILSAYPVKQVQKRRYCLGCGKPISCATIALYGAAFSDEKPRMEYLHLECAEGGDVRYALAETAKRRAEKQVRRLAKNGAPSGLVPAQE